MTDEFVLDTAVVREFVAVVRDAVSHARSPEDACAAIRRNSRTMVSTASSLRLMSTPACE